MSFSVSLATAVAAYQDTPAPRPPARPRVDPRPARAPRRPPLEPVEAAEPAAEVVDHVHQRGLAGARDDGAPVLELAVVGQDDVQQALRARGREAGDVLDRAADRVVAEWDLALELAE